MNCALLLGKKKNPATSLLNSQTKIPSLTQMQKCRWEPWQGPSREVSETRKKEGEKEEFTRTSKLMKYKLHYDTISGGWKTNQCILSRNIHSEGHQRSNEKTSESLNPCFTQLEAPPHPPTHCHFLGRSPVPWQFMSPALIISTSSRTSITMISFSLRAFIPTEIIQLSYFFLSIPTTFLSITFPCPKTNTVCTALGWQVQILQCSRRIQVPELKADSAGMSSVPLDSVQCTQRGLF